MSPVSAGAKPHFWYCCQAPPVSGVVSASSRNRPSILERSPASEQRLQQRADQPDLACTGVECRDVAQLAAAGGAKGLVALVTDLVDGLQAVDRKARTDGIQLADAASRELHDHVVGVGSQPFGRADA